MKKAELLIASHRYENEKKYWLEKLGGELNICNFPFESEKDIFKEPVYEKEEFVFPNEINNRIIQMSNNSDNLLLTILVSSIELLLNKYTSQKDILIGMPIFKQNKDGDFINTSVVLRDLISSKYTFKDIVLNCQNTIKEAIKNQNFPLSSVLNDLNIKNNNSKGAIFNIAVLLKNVQHISYIEDTKSNIIFSFNRNNDQVVECEVLFNSNLYTNECIRDYFKNYFELLEGILFNVDEEIKNIEFISNEERTKLLVDFQKHRDLDELLSIQDYVERYAELFANKTAIEYEGDLISYEMLNAKVNQIAYYLEQKGLKENMLVGLVMERTPILLECIIAIWKLGSAYIPIDLKSPINRKKEIIDDANINYILTDSELLSNELEGILEGSFITNVSSEQSNINKFPKNNLGKKLDINSVAYIIYTSGSTGNPKGAIVEHIGMLNHMWSKIEDLEINSDSVISQNSPYIFDISVWQFFTSFIKGAKTIIYSDDTVYNTDRFLQKIDDNQITILEVVPSYLLILVESLTTYKKKLTDLRYLIVTGEEVKPDLINSWFQLYPEIKVVNAYGPTEASDDISHFIMSEKLNTNRVPIGKPITNLNIYIVNEDENICPLGMVGEIYVSGVGVGRGYINDVEKTNLVFSEDKIGSDKARRLYKTGDTGKWLSDGNIMFIGRKDTQVKVRGYRIELGEIEHFIIKYKGIKEVVVIVKEEENKSNYLVCFYTANERIDASDMQNYLKEYLPEYMIPAFYKELDELKLGVTGKIDRKYLFEINISDEERIPYIDEEQISEGSNIQDYDIIAENKTESMMEEISSTLEEEKLMISQLTTKYKEKYYPLSYSQKMIYFPHKQHIGTSCENLIYIIKYPEVNFKVLEDAINNVLLNNENLRIRISEPEENINLEPVQYVSEFSRIHIETLDFSKLGEEAYEVWLKEQNEIPFEINDSDLFRFRFIIYNTGECGYYFNLHHIISDGWTTFLLATEIDNIYQNLLSKNTVSIDAPSSYFKYINDEREYLLGNQAKDDMKYWLSKLLPLPKEVKLWNTSNSENIKGNALTLSFSNDLRNKIHSFCNSNKTSIYKTILTGLAIYINRITDVDDFVIGTLNHNRHNEEYGLMKGTFIRFLPIRVKTEYSDTFITLHNRINSDVSQLLKNNSKYPFGLLVNQLREITGVDPKYFYNINLIGHPDVNDLNYNIEHKFAGYEPTPLSIHINFNNADINNLLELEWNYQIDLFEEQDILFIHKRLSNILETMLDNPDMLLSETEVVDTVERHTIENEFCERKDNLIKVLNASNIEENDFDFKIFDKYNKITPINAIGELCVSKKHENNKNDLSRSGLLAKWNNSGDLNIIGKKEQTIFFANQCINTSELEGKLKNISEVKNISIIKRNGNEKEFLAVFLESDKTLYKSLIDNSLSYVEILDDIKIKFYQIEKTPKNNMGEVNKELLETIRLNETNAGEIAKPVGQIEDLLFDSWSAVLENDNFGVNDEFFSIGGDSIKAIQIASRMRNKGFNVEIRDLFRNPTIAELSEFVVPIEKEIDQAIVTGKLPLTPIQIDFLGLSETDMHHYNQSVMLYSKERLELDAINRVFGKIQEHHDMLRTTLKYENESYFQVIKDTSLPVSIKEYNFINETNGNDLLLKEGEKLQASIDLVNGPLMKLALFHLSDGDRLLIVIHHLAMDGVSWRILFEDIENLYNQYKTNTPLKLPLKTNSYSDWADFLIQYSNSPELIKEKEYWSQFQYDKIPILKGDYNTSSNIKKYRKKISFSIDKNKTQQLLTKANEPYSTKSNELLIAIFTLAIKDHFNINSIALAIEGHGRDSLGSGLNIGRTLGWFTSIYPIKINMEHFYDISQHIIETKEYIRKTPNNGMGFGILKYLTSEENKNDIKLDFHPQISFNFLGQFDKDISQMESFAIANEKSGNTRSLEREGEYEIDFIGIVSNNQLNIILEYNEKQFKEETMKSLEKLFVKNLNNVLEHCLNINEVILTPDDLTDKTLTKNDLDQIKNIFEK